MQKAKVYDWKDSDLSLFGSDEEKSRKLENAKIEPAWKGAGQSEGLQIWKINKFKVEKWPLDQYGEFYNGDTYIILKTYKPDPSSESLAWDVHFWIGKYSTQDEYGTAAYKVVELDTYLNDLPVQHREVQGSESARFKSYFDHFTLLKGGSDTAFKRVLPESYQPRLFHVKDRRVTEIPQKVGNLNAADVFILDLGNKIYQFNGCDCSQEEKLNATQHCQLLKSQRGKAQVMVLEENETPKDHPFYRALKPGKSKDHTKMTGKPTKKLFRLTNASGRLEFAEICSGKISKDQLDSNDVFIIDTGSEVFVWVGKSASIAERRNGLAYATNYLNKTDHPYLPVTVVAEGSQTERLTAALD